MEEPLQQEQPEVDDKSPTEDQGGIRRRLRDRELLRKRRAEAEEKETNQWVFGEESPRKRSRAGQKGGARKRGRPRKSGPTVEAAVTQDDPVVAQEQVLPKPVEVASGQTQSCLTPLFAVGGATLESQPVPVAPAPVPMLASLQSPDPAPPQSTPAPVGPSPALVSPSVPVSVLETPLIPVQDSSPAPEAGLLPSLAEAPAPPPDPPQVKTFYAESQDRAALDQVLIEDLGPDEEDDIYPSQDKSVEEDLSDKPLNGASGQNKIFSNPTLSSPSPPPPPPRQEYFPGNSF